MTTIDKRIVDMQFNNQQFESGIQSSVKSIDTLKKGLDFTGTAKGLTSLSNVGKSFSLGGIAEGIGSVINKFGILEIVGITALVNLTNAAIMAGKRIITSLTIDPITKGFAEYELKMGSIQTIMAGTGESLEVVKKKLEELNEYSDKTIYSFSDMTTNIGKFTNAGVSLKDSVAAIKGIANAAALSGSNAGEASRAMYNFAQAISSGYVKLIDWKSIELANMATVEFKNQLIESAVAAGTLTKTQDGMYRTLEGTVINATTRFNDSLQDQWMTTKVLTTTLGKYADETTDVGKRATEAAQDIKTFTQLIGTLQEGVGSGWAQTWELIFGDFDEAKLLWTGISKVIGGFIDKSSDARNDMLRTWKTLGGRTMAIMGIKNIFNSLVGVAKPIQEAFASIFPPITYDHLVKLTHGFMSFTEKLALNKVETENLKRTFAGVAAVLDLIFTGVKYLAEEFWKLASSIAPSRESILAFTADIGDFLVGLRNGIKYENLLGKTFLKIKDFLTPGSEAFGKFVDTLKTSYEEMKKFGEQLSKDIGLQEFIDKLTTRFQPLKKIVEAVGSAFSWLKEVLALLTPELAKLWEGLKPLFAQLGEKIKKGVSNLNYNDALDGLNTGLFAALILIIKKFVDNAGGAKGVSGIVKLLDSIREAIQTWQKSIKANMLMTIAVSMAILAASIIALSLVDSTKLAVSLGAMTVMFGQLIGALAILEKIPMGNGLGKTAMQLVVLSAAVLVLSFAVKNLSTIDLEGLAKGLGGVAILLGELSLFERFTKSNNIGVKAGIGLILLAGAILVLSIAVQKFSEFDTTKLGVGLGAIFVLLSELGIFIKLTEKAGNIAKTAIGLMLIAAGLYVLSLAIEKIGELDITKVMLGLLSLVGTLTVVIAAIRLLPKNIAVAAGSFWLISKALGNMVKVMTDFGSFSPDQFMMSMKMLGFSMAIVTAGMIGLKDALPAAAAFAIISAALWLMVPPLMAFAAMSLGEIAASLGMLAGVFIIVGVAGLVLAPLTPVLMTLATAMAVLGLGFLAVGVGIQAFAVGMAMLAVSGVAGATAMVAIVGTLITMIPMLIIAIVAGIVQFATLIAGSATVLVGALVVVLVAIVAGIVSMIPQFVAAIFELVLKLVDTLVTNAPKLIKAGMDLIVALLQGVADNIGRVVDSAFNIIEEFLRAIGKKVPEVVDSGFKMIIDFIDGITKAIEDNVPVLIESARRLGKAIIDGIVKALLAGITDVGSAIKNIGDAALQGLKNILGIKSPSTEMYDIAEYAILGLVNGIKFFGRGAVASAQTVGEKIVSGLTNSVSKISSAIDENIDMSPVIRPVLDLDDIVTNSRKINGLLATNNINAKVTSDLSRMTTPNQSSQNSSLQPVQNGTGATISLTQYNYSPKELSRLDIYRQTRNQLFAMKGLINA